jgi:DNA-binding LytR/AlgR family response regulator
MSADQLTILAVDDEHTPLEDLARLLKSFSSVHAVECAFGGHDALLKASSEAYDAIFLDVRMPDLDGVELGRVLRRFASPPQLVFVSAYDGAAVDAFELRALDYLPRSRPPTPTPTGTGTGRVHPPAPRARWWRSQARAPARPA